MLGTARLVALLIALGSQQANTYWCAMHPDQRSPVAATCPICRMAMVPIPPMRVGEYRMDVAPMSAPGGNGLAGLRLIVREPSSGKTVKAFDTVHERPFHLFVVGRDLEFFRHLHPEPSGDAMEVRAQIPPGEYLVAADFLPTGGTPQLLQRIITSPGRTTAKPVSTPDALRTTASVLNARATPLSSSLPTGSAAPFQVVLSRTEDGRPLVDMEPYLGAGGHLVAVSRDLTDVIHAHASLSDLPGSLLTFDLTLPRPGIYAAWVEFQWRGTVFTMRLDVVAR